MTSITDATDNFHEGLHKLLESYRFLDKLQAAIMLQSQCCVTPHDIIQAQQACRYLDNQFRETTRALIQAHVRDALEKQVLPPLSTPVFQRQTAGFGPIGSEFGYGIPPSGGLRTPPKCRRELFPYSVGESQPLTQDEDGEFGRQELFPSTPNESLECEEEFEEEVPETP